MNFKRRLVLLTIILIMVWVFGFELILQFQLQTIRNMGCDIEKRIRIKSHKTTQVSKCSKLWVHRVNSLQRFQVLKNDFAGFELDAVFVPDSGAFFVRHPPDEINDLLLESYLVEATRSGKLFWIDIKDLPSDQHNRAFESLLRIKPLLSFSNQIILESSDANFVNLLAQKGFICSYLLQENLITSDTGKIAGLPALDSTVKYVSGNASIVQDLKLYYPGKKYLVWSLTAKNFFNTKNIETLITDPDVEVVLLNIKSSNYR